MPSIAVPQGYSYVLAAVFSSFPLTVWQGALVGRARRAAGVEYPRVYATEAEAAAKPAAQVFNCTQRAHQNTLETLPQVITGVLITGLKHPKLAAGLGAAWYVGRVLYTIGYTSGDPKKRNSYSLGLSSISILGTVLATGYTVFQFFMEGL